MKKLTALYLFALWAYIIVTWFATDFLLRSLPSHKALAYFGGFTVGSAVVVWLLVCIAEGKNKKQDGFASVMWVLSLLAALDALVANGLHLTVSTQVASEITAVYVLAQIAAAAVYLRLGYSAHKE